MRLTDRKNITNFGLLLLLFAFTLSIAGNTIAKTIREEVTKKYPVSGETKLYVQNKSGKTIVVGKSDIESIHISATKIVKTRGAEAAEKLMQSLGFDVESQGDEVWIISRYPDSRKEEKSFWSFFRGLKHRASIDYMIEVPRNFDVRVTSTSGDVEVSSIDGDAKLNGTSGDVLVRHVGGSIQIELTSGDVEVKDIGREVRIQLSSGSAFVDGTGGGLRLAATSGDVEAFNIDGDADVKLVSGNLTVKGCTGDLISVSSSGDMSIYDVRGSAQLSSSSGDIDIFFSVIEEGKYALSTCSGDVDVLYQSPRDIGFLLDVNTMSGTIDGDLEIKLEKVSRRQLKGVVGNGKASLVIATASGDITIYKKD